MVDQRGVAGLPAVPRGGTGVPPVARPACRPARSRVAGADDPDCVGPPGRPPPPGLCGRPGRAGLGPHARWASATAAALPLLIAAGLLAGELVGPGRGGAVLVAFPVLV